MKKKLAQNASVYLVLSSDRFDFMIAKECNVNVENVLCAYKTNGPADSRAKKIQDVSGWPVWLSWFPSDALLVSGIKT